MKTVSKSSLDGLGPDDDPTSTATTERRYFTQSAPDEDVAPQMTLPGYRFGKDLVPVAGADAEKIKYGVDAKLLQTIGVMPQEELPRREQRAERKARRAQSAPSAKRAAKRFARGARQKQNMLSSHALSSHAYACQDCFALPRITHQARTCVRRLLNKG